MRDKFGGPQRAARVELACDVEELLAAAHVVFVAMFEEFRIANPFAKHRGERTRRVTTQRDAWRCEKWRPELG